MHADLNISVPAFRGIRGLNYHVSNLSYARIGDKFSIWIGRYVEGDNDRCCGGFWIIYFFDSLSKFYDVISFYNAIKYILAPLTAIYDCFLPFRTDARYKVEKAMNTIRGTNHPFSYNSGRLVKDYRTLGHCNVCVERDEDSAPSGKRPLYFLLEENRFGKATNKEHCLYFWELSSFQNLRKDIRYFFIQTHSSCGANQMEIALYSFEALWYQTTCPIGFRTAGLRTFHLKDLQWLCISL